MVLLWLGVEPHTRRDQEKLGIALQRMMADDPSLAMRTDVDGTTMVGVSSEEHLYAVVNQLVDRFDVDAAVRDVQIAYKETVTRAAQGEFKYIKHSGGRGQYAHVQVRIEPGEPGSGCVFENAIIGGAIPAPMIPSVKEAVDEVLQRGILAGYPIDDVNVTLYDGSYHEQDSSEAAFKIAGNLACAAAVRRAKPILLEPIMNVSVTIPTMRERLVVDSLRTRGAAGFQESAEIVAGLSTTTLSTFVPLSQMFGYSDELRVHSEGLGTFTMTFSHYAPAILSEDDGDRAADVTAPLRPRTPPLVLGASVPEPRDYEPSIASSVDWTLRACYNTPRWPK
jgi:elongation factor G